MLVEDGDPGGLEGHERDEGAEGAQSSSSLTQVEGWDENRRKSRQDWKLGRSLPDEEGEHRL